MSVQYVVDKKGKKTGVLLSFEEYEHLLEMAEELEDIHDFDERIDSEDWVSLEEMEERLGVHDKV